MIIPHTAGVTAEALVAHRDYMTMLIKEEGVVVLKIIAVYASPGRAGPDLYQELGREISSSTHRVAMAGDFNKDAIKNRPFRKQWLVGGSGHICSSGRGRGGGRGCTATRGR